MEEWREIKGFEGLYQISNMGRTKSFYRNNILILKPRIDRYGYAIVGLYKNKKSKNYKVHQLVSVAFLGHAICGHDLVVNHINHKRSDNRVRNLEIVTSRVNNNQKHIKSTSKYTGVCWDKSRGKWLSGINVNGKTKYIGRYDNEIDASKAYEKEITQLKIN